MVESDKFIELTSKLQKLFQDRDNSYTLCVVIGDMECNLLRFIHEVNRPLKMKEIADLYNISNSKVTRVLNKLVKMGFVKRYNSGTDRRSWFAEITEEGKKMAENTKYKLQQFQKDVLSRIPPDDVEKIYQYISQFVAAYEDTIENSD